MGIIEVKDVHKRFFIPGGRPETVRDQLASMFRKQTYQELDVLRGLSLDVAPGEAVGIMGRNGCGKSTLLKIIAGIYQPDRGDVTVRAQMTPILELGLGWNPELDAVDNIYLLASVMGMKLNEIRERVAMILDFAELEYFANAPLKWFSSGMGARLAYSVAFATVKEIMLLDEVFAVGDMAYKVKCKRRCIDLKKDGHTIILVSHSPDEIEEFCDRALLLENGVAVCEGPPKQVTQAYLDLLAQTPVEAQDPKEKEVLARLRSEPGTGEAAFPPSACDVGAVDPDVVAQALAVAGRDGWPLSEERGWEDPRFEGESE